MITIAEEAAPATPAGGKVVFYAKADGRLYAKDDAGTEYLLGFSSPLGLAEGGTGATTAAAARTALDVPSKAEAILDTLVTTTGDIIIASAANTPARLAAGTAGYVLGSAGPGVAPAYVPMGAAQGTAWVLLQTNTPAAVASSNFDNLITATYDHYVLMMENVLPSVDQVSINIRLGTGATPTYQATNYTFNKIGMGAVAVIAAESSDAASDNLTTRVILTRKEGFGGSVGNVSNEGYSGLLHLYNARGTTNKRGTFEGIYVDSGNVLSTYRGGFMWTDATALTSIQVLPSSGNISGSISLYGVKKA